MARGDSESEGVGGRRVQLHAILLRRTRLTQEPTPRSPLQRSILSGTGFVLKVIATAREPATSHQLSAPPPLSAPLFILASIALNFNVYNTQGVSLHYDSMKLGSLLASKLHISSPGHDDPLGETISEFRGSKQVRADGVAAVHSVGALM